MSRYENLLLEAEKSGVNVIEIDIGTTKKYGRYFNNLIVINSNMNSSEKYCVLSEELGHHYKTIGDISDQASMENRKQEVLARRWGYEKLVGIVDLVNALKHGCINKYEIADYLNITEEFLLEVLEYYKCKHPDYFEIDNYYLIFNNGLEVIEKLQFKYIE